MLATGFALLLFSGSAPLLSSTTFTVPTVHYFDEEKWKAEERARRKKFGPLCRKILRQRTRLESIINDPAISDRDISDAAGYLLDGRYGCRALPDLSVALLNQMVMAAPFDVPRGYLEQLGSYSLVADAALTEERWFEIGQIMWVRGSVEMQSLKQTDAERHAFIARDDVWAYLLGGSRENWRRDETMADALLDPQSPRYDPDAAVAYIEQNLLSNAALNYRAARHLLENPAIDNSEARAVSLLKRAAPYLDDARIRYFEIVRPRLKSGDPEIRNSAVQELVAMLPLGKEMAAAARRELLPVFTAYLSQSDEATAWQASAMLAQFYMDGTKQAEGALLPWLDKQVQGGGDLPKAQGLSTLASLAMAGSEAALALIEADIARAGGAVDFGLVGEAQGLRRDFIIARDYPAAARRQELEGVVSARLLIAPNGRPLYGTIITSAGAILDDSVLRNAIRRVRLKFAEQDGRYHWVQLPDIQFRLAPCTPGAPVAPLRPDAVLVEAECRIVVQNLPIS